MKIFFARHGEYLNPKKLSPFQSPGFPLTDKGIEQVNLQADKLITEKIRTLSSSPIERCVQTATIIGHVIGLHPNQHGELIEVGSPLLGMKQSAIAKMSANPPYDIPAHIAGGGESAEQIFTRMDSFVSKLKKMSKSSSHLIVSHGDPMMFFLRRVLKKDIRYIPMGGLVMLDYSQSGTPKYTEII